MSLVGHLFDRHVRPLATAGLAAVVTPARRSGTRLGWAAGCVCAGMLLAAAALALAAVATSAFVLEALDGAVASLAWASAALALLALCSLAVAGRLVASVNVARCLADGEAAFRQWQPAVGTRAIEADGSAFLHGFVDEIAGISSDRPPPR